MENESTRLIAKDYFGQASETDFVTWADKALEVGYDSRSLRVLAGLLLPLEQSEVRKYFEQAVKELGWEWPLIEEAIYFSLTEIAGGILQGSIAPDDGCRAIYQIDLELGRLESLREWIFLDDVQISDPDDYEYMTEAEFNDRVKAEAKRLLQNADCIKAEIREATIDRRQAASNPENVTDKPREQDILLRAVNLTKTYKGRVETVTVFQNLSLEVRRGELIAITGASGAGKSTLLHLLGGLDQPTSGSVILGVVDTAKNAEVDLARLRNQAVGFVFQFHHLLPEFSALENVMMPLLISGKGRREAAERAAALLQRVGLANRSAHRPGELSGGEQQRVAVARALVNAPQLLLADEPTGNLDERTGMELFALVRRLQQEDGLTAILVTHNLQLAAQCDRVLRLENGQLIELRVNS